MSSFTNQSRSRLRPQSPTQGQTNDCTVKVSCMNPRPGLNFRFTKTKKTSCGVHIVPLQDSWPSVQVLRWFHTLRVCHLFSRIYLFSYGSWWNPPYTSLKKKPRLSSLFILWLFQLITVDAFSLKSFHSDIVHVPRSPDRGQIWTHGLIEPPPAGYRCTWGFLEKGKVVQTHTASCLARSSETGNPFFDCEIRGAGSRTILAWAASGTGKTHESSVTHMEWIVLYENGWPGIKFGKRFH